MKVRTFIKAVVLSVTWAAAAQAQQPIMSAGQIEQIRDSYIFVFDDSVSSKNAHEASRNMVRRAGGQLGHVYTRAIRGFSARMPLQAAENLLLRNPNIAYFEADQIAFAFPPPCKGPNAGDPGCDDGDGDDGGGSDPVQETPWGIGRVNGGMVYTGSGRAWVIDSGIDLDHPDLNVDLENSVDFVRSRDGGDDKNGHGTHVAGTIAAIDNGIGVVGVVAGAPVVAVRVLDRRGSGSYSDVIAGVDYVAANGALGDVANMSLGGGFSQALNDAVSAASTNVMFSLAAGNSGSDANLASPASANGANIWTVSASDINDKFASFSNYGNPPVDCAAPGVSVLSTYTGGGYATLSGTSMAAPHVAGILLLGPPVSDGVVNGDPDGNQDAICVY